MKRSAAAAAEAEVYATGHHCGLSSRESGASFEEAAHLDSHHLTCPSPGQLGPIRAERGTVHLTTGPRIEATSE